MLILFLFLFLLQVTWGCTEEFDIDAVVSRICSACVSVSCCSETSICPVIQCCVVYHESCVVTCITHTLSLIDGCVLCVLCVLCCLCYVCVCVLCCVVCMCCCIACCVVCCVVCCVCVCVCISCVCRVCRLEVERSATAVPRAIDFLSRVLIACVAQVQNTQHNTA